MRVALPPGPGQPATPMAQVSGRWAYRTPGLTVIVPYSVNHSRRVWGSHDIMPTFIIPCHRANTRLAAKACLVKPSRRHPLGGSYPPAPFPPTSAPRCRPATGLQAAAPHARETLSMPCLRPPHHIPTHCRRTQAGGRMAEGILERDVVPPQSEERALRAACEVQNGYKRCNGAVDVASPKGPPGRLTVCGN